MIFFTNVIKYWKKYINLKKITLWKIKKTQSDGFNWLSSNFLTHIIAHKSAENAQIDHQWPSPHVVEVEGKGFEPS